MYQYLFISISITSTILCLISSSWYMFWVGLEINLMSITPLLISQMNSGSATLTYLIIQSMAGLWLLITNSMMSSMFLLMLFPLMFKLGMAPFHFWYIKVISKSKWQSIMIMATLLKVAPMYLTVMIASKLFIILFVPMSLMIGAIGGMGKTLYQDIIAFSSLNHMGWTLTSAMSNQSNWMIYFFIYSIIILKLMKTVMKKSVSSNNYSINKTSHSLILMIIVLSLMGMPPLTGFIPKWFVINSMFKTSYLLTLTLILSSMISIYFYLRMFISMNILKKINEMSTISMMIIPATLTYTMCYLNFNL